MSELRDFERRLVPLRNTAGNDESWEEWADATLPIFTMDAKQIALVHQGWENGYAAAMERVRRLLGEFQTEALRR